MTFTTRNVHPKDRLGASRPSATRVRKVSEDVQARRDAQDLHYKGRVRSSEENEALRNEKRAAQRKYTLSLGALGAMALVAIGITASRGRHDQPLDVNKLPADQLTRVHVSPNASYPAAGVAGDVVNNDTPVEQVTAEIEKEVGGDVVPGGTNLRLPTNQVDPAAVEKFEHGQGG